MDLNEFRIMHSELIEHYQFIEYHLRCIYSALQGEQSFLEGMDSVGKDTVSRLLNQIVSLQEESKKTFLTKEERRQIEAICPRRNIWVHACYVDMAFDSKTKGLKYKRDINQMMEDLAEAKRLRDYFFEKKIPLQREKQKQDEEEAMKQRVTRENFKGETLLIKEVPHVHHPSQY